MGRGKGYRPLGDFLPPIPIPVVYPYHMITRIDSVDLFHHLPYPVQLDMTLINLRGYLGNEIDDCYREICNNYLTV